MTDLDVGLKTLAKSSEDGNVFTNAYTALKNAASKLTNLTKVKEIKAEGIELLGRRAASK